VACYKKLSTKIAHGSMDNFRKGLLGFLLPAPKNVPFVVNYFRCFCLVMHTTKPILALAPAWDRSPLLKVAIEGHSQKYITNLDTKFAPVSLSKLCYLIQKNYFRGTHYSNDWTCMTYPTKISLHWIGSKNFLLCFIFHILCLKRFFFS
jgi:hypothetical protein